MKSTTACLLLAALMTLPVPVSAQLLPDQRVIDFQNLVALYAKRYAPYEWKRQLFGFDLFDIRPWIDRVRAAKNDLEFFEIQAEYVASLHDTHSTFTMTSSFSANLGMTVDLYDNTVLIDSINRAVLPVRDYPFQIGDELVSVDAISARGMDPHLLDMAALGEPREYAATGRRPDHVPQSVDFPARRRNRGRCHGGDPQERRQPRALHHSLEQVRSSRHERWPGAAPNLSVGSGALGIQGGLHGSLRRASSVQASRERSHADAHPLGDR
jgi:hypothetical protein